MTSTAEAAVARPRTRPRQEIPRWDQELRAAKNSGALVKVQLAVEASFADDDCTIEGQVEDIDRNGVKIGTVWINRSFIVGTEVLSA